MHPTFMPFVELLYEKVETLLAMQPVTCMALPRTMPKAGIYVFTERGKHLYVGRSNNIKRRLSRHTLPSATHRMAAFAFRLARENTGNLKAAYKTGAQSRNGLILDPLFKTAFDDAKKKIRGLEVRFIEETEPTRQALLEIYAAIVLQTPYNNFDTH